MRKLLFVGLILVCLLAQVQAQNPLKKHSVSLKYLFLDYKGPADGGDIADFSNYTNGLEVSYTRNILPYLNVNVPFRASVADYQDAVENETTLELGAIGQAQFWRRANSITPYGLLGFNGVYESNSQEFSLMIPVGVGADFMISKNTAINIQMEYRVSTAENRSNLHHGIGIKYFVGNHKDEERIKAIISDFDGDGVPDADDLCPDVPGSEEHRGCPDTDGDGLVDYEDDCPNAAGSASLGGCPDRDNDGVADHKDDCPDVAGPVENNGCPNNDSDRDGVPDNIDRCPGTPGPAATNGCPDSDGDGVPDIDDACPTAQGTAAMSGCPDTDGDGVHDGIDKCPATFGVESNSGCPVITREIREVLEFAKSAVQFETGRANLKVESFVVLDQIVEIMRDNPTFNLNISGHTDSDGAALSNLDLSEKRAKACYDYLNIKGINVDRLAYVGYGETRPIATNNSASGKLRNRRVEFEVRFN